MNTKSIGRNDPCPCGSGKKYKQCCQNKENNNSEAAKNRLLASIPDLFAKAVSSANKGDINTAEQLYTDILAINPKETKALNNLGVIKQHQGEHQKALILFERVIKIEPNPDTFSNLGNSAKALMQDDNAIKYFKMALSLNPSNFNAHTNLGSLLCKNYNYKDAYYHLTKASALNPKHFLPLANLSYMLMRQGKYQEALTYAKKSLQLHSSTKTYESILFCLCFDQKAFMDQYMSTAKELEKLYIKNCSFSYDKWQTNLETPKKLNIGFVSGDFHDHPVGYFIESVLFYLHKSNNIKLFAYSNNQNETELTHRIKDKFSQWLTIAYLNDEQVAQQIHRDGIDILIDLSGYTALNRLNMFAYKPAPIQLSWLGYFASTGLSFIDYILVDPIGIPKDNQHYFSEKIYYLPNTRLCFSYPDNDFATPNSLPLLQNGYITFACFQNLSKINDTILTLWSRILTATQGKLLLKNPQFDDPFMRSEFLERIKLFNISEDNVILLGNSSRKDYFNSYHQVDFMLDTFPYPGGTTTCEALWMGVPTLTLTGNTLLERQGHSILHSANLDNWVCNTQEEYIQKAINFSQQPDYLAILRQQLRQQVTQSPLMNAKCFAKDFENALFEIWQQGTAQHR